jgi:hypothetical protein
VALGLEPDDDRWDDPVAPLPPLPFAERVRQDAGWLRDHAYPWAMRRLRRRSSGDLREPKRPRMLTVEDEAREPPAAVTTPGHGAPHPGATTSK